MITPGKTMDTVEFEGIIYRPLFNGEIRITGDVYFFDGKRYNELAVIIGTPQKADAEPIERSFRPVTP